MAYDDQNRTDDIDAKKSAGNVPDENTDELDDIKSAEEKPFRGLARDIADSQREDREEESALKERMGGFFKDSLEEDGVEDTGFYNPGTGTAKKGRNRFASLIGNRSFLSKKMLGGGAIGLVGIVVGVVSLFSFLNVHKLEQLLNNIDSKAFARMNATFEGRSDKWIRAYVTLRLLEVEGEVNPDRNNLYFRSEKVDTNSPLSDWYRTMRSSKFEQDLFEKNNIKFVSILQKNDDGSVSFKAGAISIKDESLNFDANARYGNDPEFIQKVVEGDLSYINKLGTDLDQVVNEQLFENNKEARAAIKKAVNQDADLLTRYRRRHLRKDIQNKIGVGDWKFFETPRDKITAKKSDIQKKLLRKLLPEDTKSGKWVLCAFGAGSCPKNADANNPENLSKGIPTGKPTETEGQKDQFDENGQIKKDENGNPIKSDTGSNATLEDVNQTVAKQTEDLIDASPDGASNKVVRESILKQIMSKLNIITGAFSIIETMDMLSRVDKNLSEGRLSELAVLAKGAQAAAAYTTYAIARDQSRTGELTSTEYGLLMETLDGAEMSEAYDTYYGQRAGVATAIQNREDACAEENELEKYDYVYNCDQYKIGAATNGTKVEELYNRSLGKFIRPVMVPYREVRNTTGVKQVVDIAGGIFDSVGSLVQKLTDPILAALGIEGGIEKLTTWFTNKVQAFLGTNPILTGVDDVAGLTYTMIGQGGAYMAQTSARASGAAISTPFTKAYGDRLTAEYLQEVEENRSISERYFAISNPNSFLSLSMLRLSNLSIGKIGNLSGWFGNISTNLSSIFIPRSYAADAVSPAEFAGLDTYDFPPYCMERNPVVDTSLVLMTNADDLLNEEGKPFINPGDITQALLEDQGAFWKKVYERVGDNGTDPDRALQIYNCETLDRRVRGSLGGGYGYTDDGGLEDGATTVSSIPNQATPTTGALNIAGTDIQAQDTSTVPCPTGENIRDGGVQDGYKNFVKYRINTCVVHGVVVNAIIARQYDNMFTAMKAASYDMKGSGGFRTMSGQIALFNSAGSNTAARPGNSNHQFGTAVDISCSGGGAPNYQQGDGRGRDTFTKYLTTYPCLNWIHTNSQTYGLLLQCDGKSSNGGEIRATTGGCEVWHISPTGG